MLAAARLSADFLARGVAKLPPAPRHARGKRLRIGYLSSDFHTHATAALLADVLEQRDRERFEVVLFSHGRDDASPMRQRIEAACDRFVDVRHLGLRETAAAMREARIDIAVDLKGFTADNRLGALAARPAPVQASWLGFPGTSGADFIDYIIGDPVVTPLEHAAWYSECIAQMPVCYQPNDARRPRPGPAAREAHGLPRDAFVLGSFNHPFKITPALFDAWAAILRAIPEAIVWQRNGGAQATENLRREAQRRGVDPARLVIAPDLPMQAHLERLSAADLALDTWPCNGHTTTSDALWAGVPVVTIKGLPFASRVAASLLHAVGLPELVCDDIDAYVKRVIALHGQPDERAALRARLVAARDHAPLFDSRRFAHDLERLYERMWARHQAGLPPQALPAA
jgi:predicted O-linked N-acetylglucosamine transferase (SPINDLY family)